MKLDLKVDPYKIDISLKLLKWASKFNKVALAFSGGKDSLVVLHLMSKILELKEKTIVLADDPITEDEHSHYIMIILDYFGFKNRVWLEEYITEEDWKYSIEYTKDVIQCCYHLKILPVRRFIEEYEPEIFIVAIRADEHPERAKEKYVSLREYFKQGARKTFFRLHPILHWSLKDVLAYIYLNRLPISPLYLKGYTSLQCTPCMKKIKEFSSIEEWIEYTLQHGDRQVRIEEKEVVMHILRRMGYF